MTKFSFEINVTKKCNFACSYCFEGNHCDDNNDIKQHLKKIYSTLDMLLSDEWWNDNHEKMEIVFWGGEPSLKPDIIRDVVNRYKDHEKVTFMMYSNGYLVDNVIRIFTSIKDKFLIQVSYDGNPIHDMHRKHKSGELTSKRVKANIEKLVDAGINISLKSTIRIQDLGMFDEAWEDIRNMGLEMGHHFRYAPTLEYHEDTPLEFLAPFEESLKMYVKKEVSNIKRGNEPVLSWLNGNKGKCGLFTAGMFVDVDGGIYYCHGCSYVEDASAFKFSDLDDTRLLKKLKDNQEKLKPQYNSTCDLCTASVCLSCNVSKYINSSKENFLDRWNDYTCQPNLCEYYKLFGKYNEVLKRLIRRK